MKDDQWCFTVPEKVDEVSPHMPPYHEMKMNADWRDLGI